MQPQWPLGLQQQVQQQAEIVQPPRPRHPPPPMNLLVIPVALVVDMYDINEPEKDILEYCF